jgi:hypothetical protein
VFFSHESCSNKRIFLNGTNLGRGIRSIECRLLREENKENVTLVDDNGGRFHTYRKNGETFGRP